MSAAFAIIGTVLAVVAALLHGGFFLLESVLWTRPATRRLFGVRDEHDAEVLRPMAFNQGFYNAFLAVGTVIGLVLLAAGDASGAGAGIVLFALASMLLAAVVLLATNPRLLRGALLQGVPPALALVFLVLALVTAGSGQPAT